MIKKVVPILLFIILAACRQTEPTPPLPPTAVAAIPTAAIAQATATAPPTA
ncbi:MAG: lytic murein transglycosylase B, partial [Anaerolinea sp.]|nr:lytic murein transglycosylase B [Anaerolinea sp.]